MSVLNRLAMASVIGGFLTVSSGCIIAPGHEHDHDREVVVEHDDRHCDDHDHDHEHEHDHDCHH